MYMAGGVLVAHSGPRRAHAQRMANVMKRVRFQKDSLVVKEVSERASVSCAVTLCTL